MDENCVWLHCLLADKDVNRGQKEPEHLPMVLTHKDYTQTAFSSIVSPGHKKIKADVEFHMEPCVHPLMVKFIVRQRKWIQADPHRCVKCNTNNNQLNIGRILLWQHLFLINMSSCLIIHGLYRFQLMIDTKKAKLKITVSQPWIKTCNRRSEKGV